MLQRPSLPHMPGPQTPASPPHNPYPHIPPLKPFKSPLPSPRCMQAVTSTSPLCHAQVRWHHPVTVRKTFVDFSQVVTLSKRKVRKRKHLTCQAFPLELQLRTSLF